MKVLRRTLLLALLAALPLAGCGDDEGGQIPEQQSAELRSLLDEALRRTTPLRCEDLSLDSFPAIDRQLRALPEDLDEDVRDALTDGVDHLKTLVNRECDEKAEDERQREQEQTDTQPETTSPPAETQPETEQPKKDKEEKPKKEPEDGENTQPPTVPPPGGENGGTPPGEGE